MFFSRLWVMLCYSFILKLNRQDLMCSLWSVIREVINPSFWKGLDWVYNVCDGCGLTTITWHVTAVLQELQTDLLFIELCLHKQFFSSSKMEQFCESVNFQLLTCQMKKICLRMKPWVIETEAVYRIVVITEYIAIFLKLFWMQVQNVHILPWVCNDLKKNHSMK